ncbi:hypothetical protein A0H81_04147 [Grifola frondosa]|uniref:Uncharacterized protein n=1 Tax=Grifola frondosa TaxID=5627 RepID=A0A1C7MG13_GRIFR|nr:hypothetical protein A0H81_04147 [Grifola frondosa]
MTSWDNEKATAATASKSVPVCQSLPQALSRHINSSLVLRPVPASLSHLDTLFLFHLLPIQLPPPLPFPDISSALDAALFSAALSSAVLSSAAVPSVDDHPPTIPIPSTLCTVSDILASVLAASLLSCVISTSAFNWAARVLVHTLPRIHSPSLSAILSSPFSPLPLIPPILLHGNPSLFIISTTLHVFSVFLLERQLFFLILVFPWPDSPFHHTPPPSSSSPVRDPFPLLLRSPPS